jgi:hypothetical protein
VQLETPPGLGGEFVVDFGVRPPPPPGASVRPAVPPVRDRAAGTP